MNTEDNTKSQDLIPLWSSEKIYTCGLDKLASKNGW